MTAERATGFTVLELVIVLVIMGILASVAVASLPAGLFGSAPDLQRVEDDLVGDLHQARSRAFGCGGGNREVVITFRNDGWDVAPDCNGGSGSASYDVPSGSDIDITTDTADDDITYLYPYAGLDGGANVQVDISGGGNSRSVCVYHETGSVQREAC